MRVAEMARIRLHAGLLCMLAGVGLAAVGQQPEQISEMQELSRPDQSGTVTVAPPSVVEDNAVVTKRQLEHPIGDVWSYGTLLRDNAGPPELIGGYVDFLADQSGGSTTGVLNSWNAGGSSVVIPPDPILAVGPGHVMACNNATVRAYTTGGTQTFSYSWAVFFSGVLPGGTFTTDPKVIYDHYSGRWFIIILALRTSDYYSHYMIAVSDDSDPNGTWKKYAIDSTTEGGSASNTWSDFPGLGVGPNALYITGNMFSRTTFVYRYSKLRIFPKQQLLDFQNTLTYSDIWNIADPGGGTAFTIQPAQHWDTPQAPFLVDSDPSDKISVFGVNDPLGTPTLTKLAATVDTILDPPSADQKGGSTKLDTVDTRVFNAVWRDDSVWFAHNISRNSRAACRWYEVDTSNWPTSISVVQSGTSSGSAVHHWFPSVAVNAAGTMLMGFCRSGVNEYASIYYAFREAGDPAGDISSPKLMMAGERYYTGEGGSPVRWGDYSGTVIDTDDVTFWHYNEFPNPDNSAGWRTRVGHISTDDIVWDVLITSGPFANYVDIGVDPVDYNGNGDGTTDFSRTFVEGTTVSLTAPASAPNGHVFMEWQLDGAPQTTNTTLVFDVLGETTASAIFYPEVALNVDSLPTDGAWIGIEPLDRNGQGTGQTPFSRTYLLYDTATLTAPASHGGLPFSHWTIAGDDQPAGQTVVAVQFTTPSTAAVANYSASATGTLTIGSTPLLGISIEVSPPDKNGEGDGVTEFERLYDSGADVTLTAPERPTAGERLLTFCNWDVAGDDQPDNQTVLTHTVTGDASLSAEYLIVGDTNGDNDVNGFDIDYFIEALQDPDAFEATYGPCRLRSADINGDGDINGFDIDPFIDLLIE
ncbi:MAG: hypothetical protein KKB50_18415 [Planctomycetes bacterium]|nr:hypothetical protein [Planctomycetota bacterium]